MLSLNKKYLGYSFRKNKGLSLIELLTAVTISGLIMVSINGILGLGLQSQTIVQEKNILTRQSQFAMQKMVQAIQQSPRLLLPLVDSPLTTDRNEAVRGDKDTPGKETDGVLAITMSRDLDQDGNGTPDADNDGDGLFDEDLPADNNNDNRGGIANIDDDKDGIPDTGFSSKIDDDEDAVYVFFSPVSGEDEDPIDGEDNDDDGSIDEDAPADMNGDSCPGICGIDDDDDGEIDEGAVEDDDEDGQSDEDWYDAVVFYVNNGLLYQRIPVPWDENGDSTITGQDYVEAVLAENVSVFTVERLVQGENRHQLINLTLELTGASGEKVSLNTQARVSSAL